MFTTWHACKMNKMSIDHRVAASTQLCTVTAYTWGGEGGVDGTHIQSDRYVPTISFMKTGVDQVTDGAQHEKKSVGLGRYSHN